MSGAEATKAILAANPQIKVIGLSMHTDPDVATAMRDAGAAAYLHKGGPSEDLILAIRACCPPPVSPRSGCESSSDRSITSLRPQPMNFW